MSTTASRRPFSWIAKVKIRHDVLRGDELTPTRSGGALEASPVKPIARSTKAQARKSPAELAARAAATNAAEGIHVRATRSKSELKKLTKARDSQAPGQGKTAEEKGHALTVSGPDVAVMDTAPLFALREQLKTRRNIIDEQIAAVEETIELLQRAPEPVVTESATETKGKPSRRSKPGVETSK